MEVKVYSTPTCPWCHKAKDFLNGNNIQFKDIDVAADEVGRNEMVEKSGQMGVPVIIIGKEVIVGFDKPKIKEALGNLPKFE